MGAATKRGCSFPFPFLPKAGARAGATRLQVSGKDSPRSTSYQEEGKKHGRANALCSIPSQRSSGALQWKDDAKSPDGDSGCQGDHNRLPG